MHENSIEMYIKRDNVNYDSRDSSLLEMVKKFMQENEISESDFAKEIGINRMTFSRIMSGEKELNFSHAIRLMNVLGLSANQLVEMFYKTCSESEKSQLERSERLAYVAKNFDIPTLKKLGLIKIRSKAEEYEQSICQFFGFKSIYQYDDTSLTSVLFSKSKKRILQEREAKMTMFWLKCATASFQEMNNPNEYDRELLIQLLKRAHEFTQDEKNGYKKFVIVLYQLGVTVLTQPYLSGTKSFGVTMILNEKPCIVITDMNKKYHKLWISILHELYHVINDFEMLQAMNYHISSSESPDLLMNENKAEQFARDILVNPRVQEHLGKIVVFPAKVNALAKELSVSPAIIYGVYLENIENTKQNKQEFAKYNQYLLPSDIATKDILFDAVERRSLVKAIEKMKNELFKIAI